LDDCRQACPQAGALISIIGTGIGFLVLGFATTLWMLLWDEFLTALRGKHFHGPGLHRRYTTKEDRAKGMGLIGAAFGLGFIFGPAIAEY